MNFGVARGVAGAGEGLYIAVFFTVLAGKLFQRLFITLEWWLPFRSMQENWPSTVYLLEGGRVSAGIWVYRYPSLSKGVNGESKDVGLE